MGLKSGGVLNRHSGGGGDPALTNLKAMGCVAWYSASGPKDVTTPGSAIGSVSDMLGITGALTQGTAANKPLLTRGDNLENAIRYSEDITNAVWDKAAYPVSVSGTTVTATAGTSRHGIQQDSYLKLNQGQTGRISVVAKYNNRQYLTVSMPNDSSWHTVAVDIQNGTLGTQTNCTATIAADVASGGYRITMDFTFIQATAGTLSVLVGFAAAGTETSCTSFTAAGTEKMEVYSSYVQLGTRTASYLTTTSAPLLGGFGSRYVPAMWFDGSNDQMATPSLALTGAKTIIGAVKTYSAAAGSKCWFSQSTSYNFALTHYNTNSTHNYLGGGSADTNGTCTNNTDHIITFTHDGTTDANSIQCYVDGTAKTAATAAATGYTNTCLVGDIGGGGQAWQGPIAEVMIFIANLSAANRQWVERFLGARCGITVA